MKIRSMCRLCGTESKNDTYVVKEMFFGTGEKSVYFKCEICQCLQILEVPKNLSKYYGIEYYSFNELHIPAVTKIINYIY